MSKGQRNRKKRTQNQKTKGPSDKGMVLVHRMWVEENFERCAQGIFQNIRGAQEKFPGKERHLYLDIAGHRNDAGGYDWDAYELMKHFIPDFAMQYLTSANTPFYRMENTESQSNDVPEALVIGPAEDGSTTYDVATLEPRAREVIAEQRTSPPSAEMIADYLGMDRPMCLICRDTPAERAHAVPKSLRGSYDVRNFALLCKPHHHEAPDVADAEAFWAWIDFKCILRERSQGHEDGNNETPREQVDFMDGVRENLINIYNWSDNDFYRISWEVMTEMHHVLDTATGRHFGMDKKASTYAWALDMAIKRIKLKISNETSR
ncbi:HNH endonuclease [Spirillospora sp. CA-108201]